LLGLDTQAVAIPITHEELQTISTGIEQSEIETVVSPLQRTIDEKRMTYFTRLNTGSETTSFEDTGSSTPFIWFNQ